MFSILLGLAAFVAYAFEWYQTAFWLLICAVFVGVFVVVKYFRDPPWLQTIAAAAGVTISLAMLIWMKAAIVASFAAAALHVGDAAGYF